MIPETIPETLFWLVLGVCFLGPWVTYLLVRKHTWVLLAWTFLPVVIMLSGAVFQVSELWVLALYSLFALMGGVFFGLVLLKCFDMIGRRISHWLNSVDPPNGL